MSKPNFCDYIFKLLFVGDSSVGKSCLIVKFCDNKFQESFISTVGIDFKIKTIEILGKRIKLQIWDTAGQERFQTITTSYFRSANAVFITYDVTNVSSFEHVANWVRQIQTSAPEDICRMLIGNKADKAEQRLVATERGQRLASDYNMLFCETSAKTGLNVEKAFFDVAEVLLKRQLASQGAVIPNNPNNTATMTKAYKSLNLSRTNASNYNRKIKSKCC